MPHASGSRQLSRTTSDAGKPTRMCSLSCRTRARAAGAEVTDSRVRNPARQFLRKGRLHRRQAWRDLPNICFLRRRQTALGRKPSSAGEVSSNPRPHQKQGV